MALLVAGSGCRKKLYENPITKDTQQPDKVLYDTAIDDVEHGRYERARIELQTLMNTYDTSEYLAKAKLAVADSWYREGGSRGMAQAEAEYKDFILFYKNMEEAAEAQMKICNMQFDQMDKSDRDPQHALRAQDECRNLLLHFPNSQYATEAEQRLRGIQEVLADEEFKVETFYSKKGSFAASANRGQTMTEQYPLYSNAADALWMLAMDYQHMGDIFENQEAAALSKIVSQYPLSAHAEESKLRLQVMKRPVPEVDPVAYARAVYEANNKEKRSTMSKVWGPFGSRPYLGTAAKSGPPQTEAFRPGIPASVPPTATGSIGTSANPGQGLGVGTGTVSGTVVGDATSLDKLPDARMSRGGGEGNANGTGGASPNGTVSGQVLSPQTPAGQAAPAAPQTAPNTPAPATTPAAGATTPAPVDPTVPATRAATTTGGKPKTMAQQEADLKREQDQIKKEKAKIQDQQKKRFEDLQKMAKKQNDAQLKKKAQEDAERKKAEEAAAKKARKQHLSTPDTSPDKQDKTDKPGGGGDAPTKQ